MADKDPSADGADQGTQTGEESAKGALLASPIARLGLFVLLLGVNAIVSFVVVQRVIRPKVVVEAEAVKVERPEVPEPGQLHVIEDIIVNPAGTRATRYLRVGAALEYDAKAAAVESELEQRSMQFRDLFITELSRRTVDELLDARIKEEIREELLARLNGSMREGQISNLYFTEYVIQ